MKILLIILLCISGFFVVFQLFTTMSLKKTETQPYTIIQVEKEFEIRYYPPVTMAMITSSAKTFRELGRSGFAKLAGYIFGGNKSNKQIAMTAPVHMDIGDSVSSMSFVMPAVYNEDNLPLPDNSDINIKTSPGEYVAATTFGGFASSENIKKHMDALENSLKRQHVMFHGAFRFLGYNPPYQLFGRKNEIIVTVDWNSK